jgi:Ribosomal protein L20
MSYSRFIHNLYFYNQIGLNRKVLSELAAMEPFAFKAIVDVVQQQQAQYEQQRNEIASEAAAEEVEEAA